MLTPCISYVPTPVTDPTATPIDNWTRVLSALPLATLHAMLDSATHVVDSQLLLPALDRVVPTLVPYPDPAIVTHTAPVAAALPPALALTLLASNVMAVVKLIARMPAVTAKLWLPRIPRGDLHLRSLVDVHMLASHGVDPMRPTADATNPELADCLSITSPAPPVTIFCTAPDISDGPTSLPRS